MTVATSRFLEHIFFPPGGLLLLCFLGLLVMIRWRRTGIGLLVAGLLLLWASSLPAVSYLLLRGLEPYPALDAKALREAHADVIVVLGAGRYAAAPEYGGIDTVSRYGLERLRYGALVHRVTGLPVVVSGGCPDGEAVPEAQFLGNVLENEFGVTPVWREEASRTTAENARFTAELLRQRGLHRILLVTHAWHEPRAVESFQREGIDVVPAPTGFAQGESSTPLLPSAEALDETEMALHEWVGRAVYALVARFD